MDRRLKRLAVVAIAAAMLLVSACTAAPRIPVEKVPDGWSLNVHQPGEWWTQPLIPRAVVMQRCPQQEGYRSSPDLTQVTALPPGTHVDYEAFLDDYSCDVGWAAAPSHTPVDYSDRATEARLRRICSTSGLAMDSTWRFLGHNRITRPSATIEDVATAAFIDEHGTVVGCILGYNLADYGMYATVELSVGASELPAAGGVCPVRPRNMGPADNDSHAVGRYELKGAGAVRDSAGRIITDATSLRIGLAGDTVTTTHPVVDGVAIVGGSATSQAGIRFDINNQDDAPAVEGQVLDRTGKVLATCRA